MSNLTNQILALESHMNLNTEAAPMTIITDTTDLAESREAFGDDYVMYCDSHGHDELPRRARQCIN